MPDGATHGELPELWAGIECTVNRVGDRWLDQLARSGHYDRHDDLDRIADLGVRALRYPVLWELVAPRGLAAADWRRADAGLARLRARGVRPIVGLVHHGSGPAGTDLLDPAFPEKLAAYAAAVARRYPWVEHWTPVNEPVTTARFSGLYGHWYPHGRDDRTFVRALLTELRATALAMEAIRAVIPGAKLVQTEDMGRTTSTPRLAYQADFDNARRWLGFDLLCGRVDAAHPLYEHLVVRAAATEADLAWFRAHPSPPDVVGLNYYVTSDRHLDERLERYPAWSHGGNGRDAYADVEAARAPEGLAGHRWVLAEGWRRYGLPVALTEVHLGAGREDQLRWLAEAWDAAVAVRGEGADVRAVTVWSLLGAFDWNTLVTADRGYYEPGAFDVRGPRPRATALAAMTRALARGERLDHPAAGGSGWWRRPDRLFPGCPEDEDPGRAPHPTPAECARPPITAAGPAVLVLGGRAGLAEAFARACAERGLAFVGIDRPERLTAAELAAALDHHAPWALVDAADTRPEDPAASEELPRGNLADGALRALAEECARRGVRIASLSSDLVFDGEGGPDRTEADLPAPLPAHPRGQRELAAERAIAAGHPGALLVRTGAWFAPWRPLAFLSAALEALDAGASFTAAEDRRVALTYGLDLAHTVLDLLVDGEAGPWHLVHPEPVSWAELARRAARIADLDPDRIVGVPAATLGLARPRPHRPLGTVRGALLAPLDSVLERYLRERVAEAARVQLAG
ncbi:MAG TPA: family 1 glycosylhydrolase [Anaeromyxobacter sp.]|nr:family 1 glycosylhydrolase [Anaeromyxobacter sp.]